MDFRYFHYFFIYPQQSSLEKFSFIAMLVTVVIFSCYDDCMVKCYLFRLACKVKSVASIISGYRHHTNCIYHYKYILPTKCFRWNKKKINHKMIIVLIPLRNIKQKNINFFYIECFFLHHDYCRFRLTSNIFWLKVFLEWKLDF